MTTATEKSTSLTILENSTGPIGPRLSSEIDSFISQIDGLAATIPLHAVVTQAIERDTKKKLNAFFDEKCTPQKNEAGQEVFDIPNHVIHEYRKLKRHADIARHSNKIVPRSLFVSLISQYDAFLGRLFRSLLLLKPEILQGTERSITFPELMTFSSMEAAREYILEKEVESLLRESHVTHFDWLEKKFNIELRKGLDVWPAFVELTERRNLYVHCDGIVSSQYLANCRKQNVNLPESTKLGHELHITPEYFTEAANVIFEVGVKLAHVLWRKARPDQRIEADENLGLIGFDLVVSRRYKLALKMLGMIESCGKKYSSDESKRRFLINICQTHKWMGNNEKCLQLLCEEDWSSCSDAFQLAVATLKDDFAQAAIIMERIGVNAVPAETDYRDWPLFQKFRKETIFLETFKKIFAKDFSELEPTPRPTKTKMEIEITQAKHLH